MVVVEQRLLLLLRPFEMMSRKVNWFGLQTCSRVGENSPTSLHCCCLVGVDDVVVVVVVFQHIFQKTLELLFVLITVNRLLFYFNFFLLNFKKNVSRNHLHHDRRRSEHELKKMLDGRTLAWSFTSAANITDACSTHDRKNSVGRGPL